MKPFSSPDSVFVDMTQVAFGDKKLVCLTYLVTLQDFMESFDINEPLK